MKINSNSFLKRKELVVNYIWISLQAFGKEGISFLIFAVTVAKLSTLEFGTYSYVLSIIFFLSTFSEFGIATAASKYVAQYDLTDPEKCKRIVFNAALIILSLGTIFSTGIFIVAKWLFPEINSYLYYVLPLVFLIPLTALYDGVYRGLKRFKKLSILSISSGAVSLIFISILIERYALIGALIAQNIYYFLILLQLVFFHRNFQFKLDRDLIKEILNYSFLVGLVNVGYFLYTKADILIMGHYDLVVEIAHYTVVEKLFMLLIIPITLFSTVRAPDVTRNFVQRKFTLIKRNMVNESYTLIFMGSAAAILLYFTMPFLFGVLLKKYDPTMLIAIFNLLVLLLPFRYFSNHINVGYITPSGFVKIITFTTICFGIVNIVLDIILINHIGYIGVVYATLISQGCAIFVSKYLFIRELLRLEERQ